MAPAIKPDDIKAVVANMEAMAMLIETGHFLGPLPVHYVESRGDDETLREIAPSKFSWLSEFYIATRPEHLRRRAVELFVKDMTKSCGVEMKN